jgi:hypothetical protein
MRKCLVHMLGMMCLAMLSASSAFVGLLPSALHQRTLLAATRKQARPLTMAVGAPGGETLAEQEYPVPSGCRKLRIPMPLGIAFEEMKDGEGAVVIGFTEDSNGAKMGVKVGETLVACSATSLRAGKEGAFSSTGYGARPFDNWTVVMFPCSGSPFEQILAALRSNNPRWGIKEISLVLQPPIADT